MTNKELISEIAQTTGMTKVLTEQLLRETCNIISDALVENKTVMLQNLGSFEVKEKKERLSVHPKTGVRTLVPPKMQVNFKPSTALKEDIKRLEQ